MARITEIRINLGRTINLGNYESGRVDVEAAVKLEPDDDISVEYAKLSTYVRNRMEEESQAILDGYSE